MTVAATAHATATAICARHGDHPAALLEILHDLQTALGHLPEAALPVIANRLNLARAEVYGVASFYHDFQTEPPPAVVVKLCRAEACQAMGCDGLAAEAGTAFADDGGVAVRAVYCLGLCATAPAAMVNGQPYGRLTSETLLAAIRQEQAREVQP